MTQLAAFALLVMPKFFLVAIGESGLRVEDIILVLLLPATVALVASPAVGMRSFVRMLGCYYGVVIVAALAAAVAGRLPIFVTLAFGLRPLLYVAAFGLGYQLSLLGRDRAPGVVAVAATAIGLHFGYGIGVALGGLPNVASFDPAHLAGLTNGPYELSAMAALMFVLFMWRRQYAWAAICASIVLWSHARIAMAAVCIHLYFRGANGVAVKRRLVLALAAVVALGVYEVRNEGGEFAQTASAFVDLRDSFSQVALSQDDYFTAAYSEEANTNILSVEGDRSALLRVARWSMVLATAISSKSSIVLGMGPGYYSTALDGNYIRAFGETGLLGLATFALMWLALRRDFAARSARSLASSLLIQLLVIAVFIDIFYSVKTMCLFWMLIGALKREEADGTAL